MQPVKLSCAGADLIYVMHISCKVKCKCAPVLRVSLLSLIHTLQPVPLLLKLHTLV